MTQSFRKMSIPALAITGMALVGAVVLASNMATFNLTINAGSLAIDVVDATLASVVSPVVEFAPVNASMTSVTSSATLGTATEQILVSNPDAADNGWTVSIASTGTRWQDAGNTVNFAYNSNVATNGQLAVNPSAATFTNGKSTAGVTGISTGSASNFSSTVSSITLLDADATSADIGDWTLQGVALSQTIPAMQAAASYSLPMTITVASK